MMYRIRLLERRTTNLADLGCSVSRVLLDMTGIAMIDHTVLPILFFFASNVHVMGISQHNHTDSYQSLAL